MGVSTANEYQTVVNIANPASPLDKNSLKFSFYILDLSREKPRPNG